MATAPGTSLPIWSARVVTSLLLEGPVVRTLRSMANPICLPMAPPMVLHIVGSMRPDRLITLADMTPILRLLLRLLMAMQVIATLVLLSLIVCLWSTTLLGTVSTLLAVVLMTGWSSP